MANSFKALEIARQLQSKLFQRLGSSVHDMSFDTDGNPLILIDDGSPAAGEKNWVIKVRPIDWPLAKDVLGNSALMFTPHVVQFVTEANPTGGAGADVLAPADMLPVMGEILLVGAQVEWYQSANGVAPTAAAIISGNLKASFYPDIYNKLTSQQ